MKRNNTSAAKRTSTAKRGAKSSVVRNSRGTRSTKPHTKRVIKTKTRGSKRSLQRWQIALASVLAFVIAASLIWFFRWTKERDAAIFSQNLLSEQYDFNPGLIISDGQFFNAQSMSEAQIQVFLEQHSSGCSGERCIASMKVDTTTQEADGECARYQGELGEAVSAIIAKSAAACGISPKVLLTMLQKEQHLVTADNPTEFQIKAAMGLSCPDDASCDPRYAGIFQQIFGAAKRFRYYQNHAQQYHYHAGRFNFVAYNPNEQCGGSDIYIENDATALLYIYTPYQPNQAALAAQGGEGDACSSYGNRNFSLIYSNWFGNPRS